MLAACAPNLPAAPAAACVEDPRLQHPTQRVHVHGGLQQPQQQGPAARAGKRRKSRTRRTRRNPNSLEQAAASARDGHGSSVGGIARADSSHCDRGGGVQDRAENRTADTAAGCKAHAQANTLDPSTLERSLLSLAQNCADVLFPAENFVDSDEEDGGVMEHFKCYMNRDLETIRRYVLEQANTEAQPRVSN
jgi:hypothetical protein